MDPASPWPLWDTENLSFTVDTKNEPQVKTQ